MNDYSKISAESPVDRLAVITSAELPEEPICTVLHITEPTPATNEELWALHRQIHAEIDAQVKPPSWEDTFSARYRVEVAA